MTKSRLQIHLLFWKVGWALSVFHVIINESANLFQTDVKASDFHDLMKAMICRALTTNKIYNIPWVPAPQGWQGVLAQLLCIPFGLIWANLCRCHWTPTRMQESLLSMGLLSKQFQMTLMWNGHVVESRCEIWLRFYPKPACHKNGMSVPWHGHRPSMPAM